MGPIGAWFFEGLAGIRPDPSGAGFKHFLIAPGLNSDLRELDVSYEGPYGRISVAWTSDGDRRQLTVGVPFNTTASLLLEGTGWRTDEAAPPRAGAFGGIRLTSGTHRLDLVPDASSLSVHAMKQHD
jgi:hypothetical protein